MDEVTLGDATTAPALLAGARALFREYADSLVGTPAFTECVGNQGLDDEIASLPGQYTPPAGALLVASVRGAVAGCVALRPLDEARCEMKRMYVRPAFRGQAIGRVLAEGIVAYARKVGYHRMLLDTMPHMREAIALYRALGFRDAARYRFDPVEELLYFELVL